MSDVISAGQAHGGQLINLYAQGASLAAAKEQAKHNLSWDLTKRQMCDIELLLNGAFSPLEGFMGEADYNTVLDNMRLADGTLWPMPITLDVSASFAEQISSGQTITLRDAEGVVIANMTVGDCWRPDKTREAEAVFGSSKDCHPGVHYLNAEAGDYYLGGRLVGVTPPLYYDFKQYRDSPASLRAKFASWGWNNVIALQTRNPMHRAHVIMTKRLMAENNANFVIHTAVGMTKPGDLDHYCRVRCYEKVLKRYPASSAQLSLVPLGMRMAGPREALWQAIIRQNYGFSHFVVGHDHAGPGLNDEGCAFYTPEASQQLVLSFQDELNIKVLPAPFLLYAQGREEFCEQGQLLPGEEGLYISGAELREILKRGDEVPDWFAFPEIVEELQHTMPPRSKQGFTVFFTGLSGSGKSTLANGLMVRLRERGGRHVTLLDGDVVRKNLSSELSFSKEHRELNIQRIGYVASEITRNGGVAICAPIAPYLAGRRSVRNLIAGVGTFIEIHVSTPIEVCEGRDRKGLYAMARAGKVKGFTGIDDPYQEPENPEMRIDTSQHEMAEAIEMVMARLESIGVI
ncbi:bifunctional sulfate adenylyltransferase/adenylylsulfate kinase [Dasania marina]|uniref:bifunctional sulfate adenylyltransferase/adenylylsulfate kinase n=1 Tax=Dasania marina TaxID=471499 RepID=UPI0030D95F12|tara:strand:+ start:1954 stop:3672 length:1719 start_codon:yes stop_codon:yes gene_type:complete